MNNARNLMTGPNRRQRHHSSDESLDKPAKLIESEATEVEEERPAEENEALQQVEKPDSSDSSAFEEE